MSDWKNDKEYWTKRENKLPLDADTKSLRILVDKIIKDMPEVELKYNIPYADNGDFISHTPIAGQWWAGISIMEDGFMLGNIKLVKYPNQDWKYYNVKMYRSHRKNGCKIPTQIETNIINYFKFMETISLLPKGNTLTFN